MKILEFKLYDLLKNKDNEDFLNKVKKENPDKYSMFIDILGNKGLETAKLKYEIYDPEFIKKEKEKEKTEKAELRKQNRIYNKEQFHNEILQKYSSEINVINDILRYSLLKKLQKQIKNDGNLLMFSKQTKAKYTNNFLKILKNDFYIRRNLTIYDTPDGKKSDNVFIDMLEYIYEDLYYEAILTIKQHYNLAENKFLYDVSYKFSIGEDFSFDRNKESDFIDGRNNYLDKLKLYNIDKVELYKNINIFSKLFSKNFYDDWYKDWTFKNKVNKYNL
ncbi:hypothetical protein M0Q97_03940 [Candidatus Dojkabacteria bacterium]|jgi:hypothetical protein|nr:hypothetical protein [Candidatus Dojkabacteria bacterium]